MHIICTHFGSLPSITETIDLIMNSLPTLDDDGMNTGPVWFPSTACAREL